MNIVILIAVGVLIGAVLGEPGMALARWLRDRRTKKDEFDQVAPLVRKHFRPTPLDQLTISSRKFPLRVRADIQRAIDQWLDGQEAVRHFSGLRREYHHRGISLSDCLDLDRHDPVVAAPPEYEDLDVGEEEPVRCLSAGLWLLVEESQPLVVLLSGYNKYGEEAGIQFQVGATGDEGERIAKEFFRQLEAAVEEAQSYRGKVLSLEEDEVYSGESRGIVVHQLKGVARDEVILPKKTLELLERNVIQFVQQRPELARAGQATKKGLLFYGPPGTGKTHTIHYLTAALPGHTTLLVSAEQVALLGEYMTLARMLQPSIVVLEDVDLIARDRGDMHSPCEEVLLNKLLNEMDGLKEEADILFILTTNRPETLERALSSRPGRIDQAIEFPLPDEEGRDKLVRLYSRGIDLPDELVGIIVDKTADVSAAFIRELMRRTAQFHLQRDGQGPIQQQDVDNALDEMLFAGGSLNLKLLGAEKKAGQIGF